MIYLIFLFYLFINLFHKNFYLKKALVATINERSSHTTPTPHGGGIAIAIVWFIGIIYLYFINNIDLNLFYALLVGLIISIVSFFDDIFELSSKLRLIVQSIVAIIGLIAIEGLSSITFGFFVVENQILTNIFAFLLIIWFINLYNFLDGIDGYAGSEIIFLSLSAFLLFTGNHFLILAVATLGFLIWNWHKAKIFMGDVGSTLLGYNVAIFTIFYANNEATNLWIWIILFSTFWFDATLTLFRRYKNNEKLSQAHKKHFYQRLTQSNWSHGKVVKYSIILNLILFSIIIFTPNVAISFILSIILLFLVAKFIDKQKSFI